MKLIKKSSLTVLALFLCAISVSYADNTIVIKGSDTASENGSQLAEAFKANMKKLKQNIAFEIAAEGSSTGVASVIDATSEIGISSRDPKAKEITKAQSKGVDMKAITVAKDGIAIIVNESSPLESISLEEIEMIFSGDVTDWSAINTSIW